MTIKAVFIGVSKHQHEEIPDAALNTAFRRG